MALNWREESSWALAGEAGPRFAGEGVVAADFLSGDREAAFFGDSTALVS